MEGGDQDAGSFRGEWYDKLPLGAYPSVCNVEFIRCCGPGQSLGPVCAFESKEKSELLF